MRAIVMAVLAAMAAPALAQSPPRRAPTPPAEPAMSASQRVMAGSVLSVMVRHAPAGARLAIARTGSPATSAIVVEDLGGHLSAMMPVPGVAAAYELRLNRDEAGTPVILLRQPLIATEAEATVAAPERVRRRATFPARGIGPNGMHDRVVLAEPDMPADASGPSFFPGENIEATLEAPDRPGRYELHYIMNAPLAEGRILARQAVTVD